MTRALPLLAALCMAVAFRLSMVLDGTPLDWDRKEELSVWSADSLKRFFPGYEDALADIYWLRTVQYHGGQVAFNPESKLDLLETYLEITTSLDPRFEIAYRYGAVFLSEGRFGANNPHAGIRLLERGLHNMPDNWRLAADRAMFTSFYLKDAALAAKRTEEASRMPDAPSYLKIMAAMLVAEGNSVAAARSMWAVLASDKEEPFVRVAAKRHLDRLDAVESAKVLTDKLVPDFVRLTGRDPETLQDFIRAGLLAMAPKDPSGTPFVFDAADRRFRVSPNSPLYLSSL